MSRIRLCAGLLRGDKWYNYAEVEELKGGVLALLDGEDKAGASRILHLVKGAVSTLVTEEGENLDLTSEDYLNLAIADAWKISRKILSDVSGKEYFSFPEYFFCPRCSRPGSEQYTLVEESWDKLIEDGFIDEIYLKEPLFFYETILPDPILIPAGKTIMGGNFNKIRRKILTIGDVMKIQKSSFAQKSDANLLCVTWDASFIGIEGMTERDFNILVKRDTEDSFSKKYIVSQRNIEALTISEEEHSIGLDPKYRSVTCSNCAESIGGSLDFTNFFSLLLPKKSVPRSS